MEAVGIDHIRSKALVRVLVGEPLISVVTDESRGDRAGRTGRAFVTCLCCIRGRTTQAAVVVPVRR